MSSSSEASSSSRSPPTSPKRARSPSPDSDHEEFTPASPEVVEAYDKLMSSLMPEIDLGVSVGGDVAAGQPATSAPTGASTPAAQAPPTTANTDADDDAAAEAALGRPMTKAEKQNAKKKRRKERERALRAEAEAIRAAVEPKVEVVKDAPVEFRLFSAVQPVSLSTVETYPVTTNPRLAPLPTDLRAKISRIATESAVTIEAIEKPVPSYIPTKPVDEFTLRPGQDLRAKHERGKGKKAEGNMPIAFVAMAPLGKEGKCVAFPHAKLDARDEVETGKRKRRRRAYREFPPAQFWTPAEGEEDASAGYFYGWSV